MRCKTSASNKQSVAESFHGPEDHTAPRDSDFSSIVFLRGHCIGASSGTRHAISKIPACLSTKCRELEGLADEALTDPLRYPIALKHLQTHYFVQSHLLRGCCSLARWTARFL